MKRIWLSLIAFLILLSSCSSPENVAAEEKGGGTEVVARIVNEEKVEYLVKLWRFEADSNRFIEEEVSLDSNNLTMSLSESETYALWIYSDNGKKQSWNFPLTLTGIADTFAFADAIPVNLTAMGIDKALFAEIPELKQGDTTWLVPGEYPLEDGQMMTVRESEIQLTDWQPDKLLSKQEYKFYSYIVRSEDDAEEAGDGTILLDDLDLDFGVNQRAGDTNTLVGLRFDVSYIPEGATILEARLWFAAQDAGSQKSDLYIGAENSLDPAKITATPFDLSERKWGTTWIRWSPGAWETDSLYYSPDIAEVVQNVVNYGAPQHMLIGVSGVGFRDAISYDQDPKMSPTLYIRFLD